MPSRLLALAPLLAACTGGAGDSGAPLEEPACNGHASLCDRTLDDVTFPGTHNSMSNADAGWGGPNQQHGMTRQLEDGIRALMLDTYEWNGELYLCHSICEFGAQPLDEGLGEIETFLAANPGEVVLIIFQDAIPVEDTVSAMEAAGLADRVWTWDPDDDELPTLGQLVDDGTRLVVGTESARPPPDWVHHAWDLFSDTPYSFASAEEFSCELNRGEADNPLFLVNHWLSTPLPTQEGAAEVNVAAVLGARADACEAERGRRITFLGVDFYEQGDLFEVVGALNGVGERSW